MSDDPTQPTSPAPRWQRLREHRWTQRAYAFYRRHERYAPVLFFFGGATWDALTLDRIDAWGDNALLFSYLVLATGLVVLTALAEYEVDRPGWMYRYRTWFPHALQFVLGAMFSAHVIFYFQSATLAPTAVFLGVLVVLLVANEIIHQRLFDLYLLIGLYYLAVASFFVFFIPVVTRTMSYGTFLAGGLMGLVLAVGVLVVLARHGIFEQMRRLFYGVGVVGLLFGLLNLLYLQNWMPPVPLAMRHGGVYHEVERVNGDYRLRYEPAPWYALWKSTSDVLHHVPGDTVYAFAAVFAPTKLETRIYHEWSAYDEGQAMWVVTDTIDYDVVGGRNEGYRGYTFKQNVRAGRWQVDVETASGRLVGRIRFRVEPVDTLTTPLRQRVYR